MWPWEHVIVGYVAYSLLSHLVYREAPGGGATLAVVFAALVPDLIDKPLAWQFDVFPGGYALAHSVFFAVPVVIAVGLLAYRVGRPRVGLAFGGGYLVHLPCDLLPTYVRRGEIPIDRLLWPVEKSQGEYPEGLIGEFIELFVPYAYDLVTLDPSPYLLGQLGLMGCALLLWIYDGMPVLREVVIGTRRRMAGERRL